jgi:hypothetical protein
MKKVASVFLVLAFLGFILSACSSRGGKANNGGTDLPAQYIRGQWASDTQYPVITVVSSKSELEQYYEKTKMLLIDGYGNELPDTDYLNAIEKYSDDFFAGNYLVIVLLSENSGSIRHKVEKIDANGDIVITRQLPEMGTADMAAWNIIIELNNDFKPEQYQVVLTEMYHQ